MNENRMFKVGRSMPVVILALIIGLMGGIVLDRQVLSVDIPTNARAEFELIAEAWQLIERRYVFQDKVEPRPMAHSAISGIVRTLGDTGHTRFMDPEVAAQHENQLEGEFEGIGAYVESRDGRVVIVTPIDNSPAQRAGLEAGDAIIAVNGEDVSQLSLSEVTTRVLGPAGTEVTLTILDAETGDTREVTLERAEVDLDLVTWQQLPGTAVAYVRISAFSRGATEELSEALSEIQAQPIDGLILDIRNNPGGLLSEAVGVTSRFVDEGNVLLRRNAQGEVTSEPVEEDVPTAEIPMVVIVNGGTASAAEIVTGALQDHERARAVGTTTSGAGTVLTKFTLTDESVMLLATEEWLTPNGREIWQQGLQPDIEVTLPQGAVPLIRQVPRDITEEQLRETEDVQLLRALALLQGLEDQ